MFIKIIEVVIPTILLTLLTLVVGGTLVVITFEFPIAGMLTVGLMVLIFGVLHHSNVKERYEDELATQRTIIEILKQQTFKELAKKIVKAKRKRK